MNTGPSSSSPPVATTLGVKKRREVVDANVNADVVATPS
jgi:hypothetical protein